jgi:cytochrome c oxidase subunit II
MNIPISPEQASTIALSVDIYFYMLVVLCSVLTIGIFTSMIFMAVKFRKIEGEDRPSIPLENVMLEITWTVIPFLILLGLFFWSTWIYGYYLKGAPEDSLQINVVGKQWMWKVQHPNGKREVNDLHIPIDVPIQVSLSSQDVLHDYFIPAFRVKQDVVPGRVTKLWFEPTMLGEFHIFCAEYCGTEHSYMKGTVTVLSQEDYAMWLEGALAVAGEEAVSGEKLFKTKGCVTCHSGLKGLI